jgi:hypothetical protein
MSALGHKRTWWGEFAMSALPPKADIAERDLDVRFVPKTDIMQCSKRLALFDHLIGQQQHRLRHRQPYCFCCLQVDDKLEFGRCLHWHIPRFFTLENPIDVRRHARKLLIGI